jgi:hypothetical protein
VIADATEHVGKPGAWIDIVHLAVTMSEYMATLAGKLSQEASRGLQVDTLETFTEPCIDRRKQCMGVAVASLTPPKPCQARRTTQFPGKRILLSGHIERLVK